MVKKREGGAGWVWIDWEVKRQASLKFREEVTMKGNDILVGRFTWSVTFFGEGEVVIGGIERMYGKVGRGY